MDAESLKGHLDLLLLAIIEEGPLHGYAIAEALRRRSRGTFDLPEGTLYPALHRLEHAGLLSSRWSAASGRRRRVYQITVKGLRKLKAKHEDWRQFAQAMHAIVRAR